MTTGAANSGIIAPAGTAEDECMPSVYRKTGSPYWYANIKGSDGKRLNYSTGIRAIDAVSRKRAMHAALEHEEEHRLVKDGKRTVQAMEARQRGRKEIGELLAPFLATIASPAQRDETRRTLERFTRDHDIRVAADFGVPSIVGAISLFLIGFQKRKASQAWMRKRLYHLRRFGDWLWKGGHILSNETEKADPLHSEQQHFIKHRALTPQEAERLIGAAEVNLFTSVTGVAEALIPPRRQLYYRLRLFAGARDREALRLCRGDLDLNEEPSIHWPADKTKNKHGCVMPLAPLLAAELAEQVGMMHPKAELFPDMPANEDVRLAMLRRDLAQVGIADPLLIGRSFRKTFCTWLEVAGVELGTRMKLRRDVGQGSAKLAAWTYSDDHQAMRVLRDGVVRLEAWYAGELRAGGRKAEAS